MKSDYSRTNKDVGRKFNREHCIYEKSDNG